MGEADGMTAAVQSGIVDAPVIVNAAIRRSAIERARAQKIVLPTFAQLSWREPIPDRIAARLPGVDPDDPRADNLWRVHGATRPTGAMRSQSPTILCCQGR